MAAITFAVCVVTLLVVVTADPVVETAYGPVRGRSKIHKDLPYDEFLGIPFAEPLIGDKRWDRPQPPEPWSEVREADKWGPYCVHIIGPFYPLMGIPGEQSEDCLYMNVWVPGGVNTNRTEPLPVMVWIFPGAFAVGASNMYPLEEVAVLGNVVTVNFNYRLGALGFLATGDDKAMGNFGLWDDELALKWVNENIGRFGGDASRVTVFGQSAGAASTSHLVASPKTRNLFHRTIKHSGSSLSYFATTGIRKASDSARSLGILMGCLNYRNLIPCLQKKSPILVDLVGLVTPLVIYKHLPNWVPVVDEELVAEDPYKAIEGGAGSHHDMLMGSTQDDAAGFIYLNPLGMNMTFFLGQYASYMNLAGTEAMVDMTLDIILAIYDNPRELKALIVKEYPDIYHPDDEVRTRAMTQLGTEFLFGAPAKLEADLHSRYAAANGKNTYLFRFHHRQSFLKYPSWVTASHMDDIYSMLGEPFLKVFRKIFIGGDFNDVDRELSHTLIRYYANFAYTGNPNEGPHTVPTEWPKYESADMHYMKIKPQFESATLPEELLKKYAFWNEEFHDASSNDLLQRERLPDAATFSSRVLSALNAVTWVMEKMIELKKDPAEMRHILTMLAANIRDNYYQD